MPHHAYEALDHLTEAEGLDGWLDLVTLDDLAEAWKPSTLRDADDAEDAH